MVESLFKAERLYLALIASLRDARRVEDRKAFQAQVLEAVDELNHHKSAQFASRLALPTGEEIHGLYRAPDAKVARSVVELLSELTDRLAPVRVAFGLGVGPLSTDLSLETLGMDGPCFHRAREALEQSHKNGVWLTAKGFGETRDMAISSLFILMGAIRRGWTRKQRAYARAARGKLRKDVAREFGVSPSVVSESLRAARFDEVLAGEAAAERLIAQTSYTFGSRFMEKWKRTG